jgi:DNA-binding MarR family transcriptional regulator
VVWICYGYADLAGQRLSGSGGSGQVPYNNRREDFGGSPIANAWENQQHCSKGYAATHCHSAVNHARIDGQAIRIANYASTSSDAKELRGNLYAAAKKPVRTVIAGQVYILKVRIFESFGEDAYEVSIEPAPKLDPSAAPSFTAKQGQYLAFIHYYTKVHRQAPSETDLERYFRVSAPSIHEMIKTLERNGLIEKVPRQARSMRVLVRPEHLPQLG